MNFKKIWYANCKVEFVIFIDGFFHLRADHNSLKACTALSVWTLWLPNIPLLCVHATKIKDNHVWQIQSSFVVYSWREIGISMFRSAAQFTWLKNHVKNCWLNIFIELIIVSWENRTNYGGDNFQYLCHIRLRPHLLWICPETSVLIVSIYI